MAINHTGNDTAWGCLYWAQRSLHKGERQALSVTTRRSLADLPALVAHQVQALSCAAEPWPWGKRQLTGPFWPVPPRG